MNPQKLFGKMLSFYGRQLWWPVTEKGEITPTYKKRAKLSENQKLEIAIGAILTQNTDWKNVMRALENLNREKMLSCKKIANAPQAKLAALVRPSGYYNQKARKIKFFCNYLEKNYSGKIEKLFEKPVSELREELLSLHGIGNETADDIILYAAEKPVFVVDAYTKRFVGRFCGKPMQSYVENQCFFEENLPKNTKIFNEFHALIVEHGKRYCRKKPLCEECFLNNSCPFFLSGKHA
ncbi:MAG: hypothetical protein JW772_02390 [Candidatus Diapherotrites archaeon]|nr:hypothetical protein [Candidatus Diapherotrites archaeon]